MSKNPAILRGVALCVVVALSTISEAKPAANRLPPDSVYVTVSKDGHLMQGNKRVRFWGTIGAFTVDWNWQQGGPKPGDSPEVRKQKIEARYRLMTRIANRIDSLGFNLWRSWHVPSQKPWTKGDGSDSDLLGFFLNELAKRDMKMWMATLHAAPVRPEDVDIVKDPSTADAWREAVEAMSGSGRERPSTWCVATFWDPRLEAIGIRTKLARADFRNHYRGGMRLADDPMVVVWELSNEEWWFNKMVRGQWQNLPDFFQQQLLARWNKFLQKKYGSDKNLTTAWLTLLPGESLKDGTVQLAPLQTNPSLVMPNDANPAVRKLLNSAAKGSLTRDKCARQRSADVIEFIVGLQVRHKQAEYAALKKHGKSCRLSPILFDTGEGYQIQSLFLHQNADAASVCTYMTGIHNDSTHELFPWYSGLTEPPRLCWNVPWIESQRVPNKPFFVYETGFENPGKYRTEFPYRIASVASIQDFDIVVWHTQNGLAGKGDTVEFDNKDALHYSAPGNSNPQGLHFYNDEVLQSAIQGAGEVFKNCHVSAAPNPTTYVFGKKSLYDPATMDWGVAYGKYGNTILPTTYRHGTRMYCDTSRMDDSVYGAVLNPRQYEPNPFRPTDQITHNWRKGYLMFDAPGTAVFTGFYANYGGPVEFDNGVKLDNVKIANPEGIAYPVGPEELYVSFSLSARDGRTLAKTADAVVSLVSTSFNTGFELDEKKIRQEFMWQNNTGATKNLGTGPQLIARVGATISAKALNGMRYVMRDWSLKPIARGKVKKGVLTIPADLPVYITELYR